MFFQFSPVRRKANPEPVIENESEKIEYLLLAPFTPIPKLSFDNIQIGDTAVRQLLIKNPTNNDITLSIIKTLPDELNVSYNWIETCVRKNSEVIFEITWTPLNKESVRHTLTFKALRTIPKDVHIAFTSIPQNKTKDVKKGKAKQKTTSKISPTKKYYSTRPTKISPSRYSPSTNKGFISNKYSPSPVKISKRKSSLSPKKKQAVETYSPSVIEKYLTNSNQLHLSMADCSDADKENVPSFVMNSSTASNIFVSPKNVSFTMDYFQPIGKRGTFVLGESKDETCNLRYKKSASEEFNDSLENISPKKSPIFDTSFSRHRQRLPLIMQNGENIPASFQEQNVLKTKTVTNYDFECKLSKFCFTPVTTPVKKSENVASNLEGIHFKITPLRESPQNRTYELPLSTSLNISAETYIKSNMSSDTYVKGNASFETYVRGNISDGTYTKDSSIGDINSLSTSPLRANISAAARKISPTYCQKASTTKPAYEIDTDNMRKTIESNVWTGMERLELSCIAEESYAQPSMRDSTLNLSRNSTSKRKSDIDFNSLYPKKACTSGPKDWSKKGGSAFRVAKRSSGLNLRKFKNTIIEETLERNTDISKTDTSTMIIQNPFILAATNLIDPFMTSNLYVNSEWIDQQENDFKKWLNSLLTPPEELSSEERVIDVAKVWQECKKREVDVAPSKEVISSKYHTNTKMKNLRESAQALFRSKEMSVVLTKVLQAVDSGKLSIRKDKDVHLNLSLKSEIVAILLSYNSLWLRIGLETIYNEVIPLNSNSDVIGLSTFIANRLLKDPYLIKRYKSIHTPKYTDEFNKFFLKKFLILVYFLDQAKNRKLIPHDPCLFCKNSTIKESKEVLLRLAREILSAVGDITKSLKYSGYIVSHSQSYIHEFDYAVNNLGVELRDGVRLTKIMEIILLRNGLSVNLRVPAISRLQKIHNMKIVFDSLQKAGYSILYDISPKDIVDGHKEKTLSFLWQIIYKFEAPLMVKSATTIQTWFRSLPVLLKRRRLARIRSARENASKKIQNWYKRIKLSEKILYFVSLLKRYIEIMKRERAAIKIQSYYRMYYCRKMYKKQIRTIICIQSISRGWLVRNVERERIKSAVVIQSFMRMYLAKKKYLELKRATSLIQEKYRAHKRMKAEKYAYDRFKSFVIFVQRKFRANRLAFKEYQDYQELKSSVLTVQRRFRANRLCREQHESYLKIKAAAVYIQTRYRSLKTMRILRARFLALKRIVLIFEERFLALKTMRTERQHYIEIRSACIIIQQRYRAWKLMVKQRTNFLLIRKSASVIQQAFRAKISMHYEVCRYETLRSATIFIQRKFRANRLMRTEREHFVQVKTVVVKIQMWYRATVEMRKCHIYFLALKHAVHIIEKRYEANKLMKKDLLHYQRVRSATLIIQRKYRGQLTMRSTREKYCRLRLAALLIQRKFRARKMGKLQRNEYLKQKEAAITIQRQFRAQMSMRQCRKDFINLRMSAIVIQRLFLANIMMKKAKYSFKNLREKTVFIQRTFRANKAMVRDRESYRRLREATITIQRKWRATILMRNVKEQYKKLRDATLVIQRRWHAKKLAKQAQMKYKSLIRVVVNIQRIWRANKISKKTRENFVKLKWATIVLQQRWRGKKSCESQKRIFSIMKNSTLLIQSRWRATKKARLEYHKYQNLKLTAVLIQRRWRANKLAYLAREHYTRVRNAALVIQRAWRARQKGLKQRKEFIQLKNFTSIIQMRWRAKVIAREQKFYFEHLKKSTIFVQQKWKAKKLAKSARISFVELRSAVVLIQNRWRAKKIGTNQRKCYTEMLRATVIIQRKWRAWKLGRGVRHDYAVFRNAVLVTQQRWRAQKAMNKQLKQYTDLKQTVVLLQRRFRANIKMKVEVTIYKNIRTAAITVQRYYRGYLQMRKEQAGFLRMRKTVIAFQRYARGYLVRRKYAYYFTVEAKEQRRILQKQTVATTKIQAVWRGYKCRSSQNSECRKIRERFKTAMANAIPEKTLEWKCRVALQTFANTSSTLLHIIKALQDIDFTTRRCKNICLELGSLLPDQLYIMLSATSRSLPEMKACIHSVNILISFCKYPPTRKHSFVPKYIDNLIHVMLHWCDKDSELFPTLCTLFWHFAHTPQWKRFILNLPNIDQRLKKIQGLVSRKESMVKRSVVKGVSHFAPFKNLPMPSLNPDWGLEYKSKPNVFSNSIHAFASLLSILNM